MMPLRVPALVRIDHDLRFAPVAAARRQTVAAERLAGMLDPGVVYPEDFVVYQLTGFRPALQSPELIPGEALIADMPALLDRLSRRAAFTRTDLPEPKWLTVAQVARTLGISRKTIERLRRKGLLARRVSLGGGRSMNVFSAASVERVAAARPGGPAQAPRRRPSAVERVARATGTHGPRRTADERSRRRRLVERAVHRGVAPAVIASRLSCSAGTVHRLYQQALAERCRSVRLVVPSGAAALMPEQAERFLADPAVRRGLVAPAPMSVDQWVDGVVRNPRPDPLAERARAFGYWALLWRAQRIARGIDRTRPASAAVDRVVTDLRWAAMVKAALVWAEGPLLLRTVEAQTGTPLHRHPPGDAAALLWAGIAALSLSVDRFDPAGGRLAGVSGLELSRAVSAWQRGADPAGRRARAGGVSAAFDRWSGGLCAWQVWTDAPRPVLAGLERLPPPAARLLIDRFGLAGDPPQTLEELAAQRRAPLVAVARNVRSAMADSLALVQGRRARRRRSRP